MCQSRIYYRQEIFLCRSNCLYSLSRWRARRYVDNPTLLIKWLHCCLDTRWNSKRSFGFSVLYWSSFLYITDFLFCSFYPNIKILSFFPYFFLFIFNKRFLCLVWLFVFDLDWTIINKLGCGGVGWGQSNSDFSGQLHFQLHTGTGNQLEIAGLAIARYD